MRSILLLLIGLSAVTAAPAPLPKHCRQQIHPIGVWEADVHGETLTIEFLANGKYKEVWGNNAFTRVGTWQKRQNLFVIPDMREEPRKDNWEGEGNYQIDDNRVRTYFLWQSVEFRRK